MASLRIWRVWSRHYRTQEVHRVESGSVKGPISTGGAQQRHGALDHLAAGGGHPQDPAYGTNGLLTSQGVLLYTEHWSVRWQPRAVLITYQCQWVMGAASIRWCVLMSWRLLAGESPVAVMVR